MVVIQLPERTCEKLIETGAKELCNVVNFISSKARHKVRESSKDQRDSQIVKFDSIRDFWEAGKEALARRKYVSVEGALSVYTPMLLGPPKLKREVHRAYRRAIPEEDYRQTLPDKEYKDIKTTVDANLAFTAGQMVWRLGSEDLGFVHLGLYHSIVRNSISVFVDRDYYSSTVEHIFAKARSPHVVEAKVVGRLECIPSSFIKEFVEENKMEGLITPRILGDKDILVIVVDGHDTKIEYIGAARYLDGDIWVAVDKGGRQFFVSRFLDLADPDDLKHECSGLEKEVNEMLKGAKIISQFDQVDKLVTRYEQAISVDDFINLAIRRT